MTDDQRNMPTSAPSQETTADTIYRDARAEDAPIIGRFMYEHITWARIREFGLGFLVLIHHALCVSKHAVCKIAERDGKIIGYCAGVADTDAFNREFKWKYGWKAALYILPQLFKWRNWQTLWKGLTYYSDVDPTDPRCEMSAFSVDPNVKGTGVGRTVFDLAMKELRRRGATGVRLGTIDARNERANAFYQKFGFKVARTVPFYADSMVNIYIYRFDD